MINYKLAKEIGATHCIGNLLYKFNDSGVAMCYFSEYGWEKTENDSVHMAKLERIDFKRCAQPKRTRTEYEKVTESIFDLKDAFERGELYFSEWSKGEVFVQIKTEVLLLGNIQANNLYRRVEKEIDERQEFIERAKRFIDFAKTDEFCAGQLYDAGCRFAGANGEIE